MTDMPVTPAEKDRRLRRRAVWGILVFALTLSSLRHMLPIFDYPDLKLPFSPANPDVWLRLTEVRQWLTGGGFFNHGVPRTNAPFGGITTPWTRPIDIILSLLYFFTPHHLSATVRLMFAATWMAPAFCVVAVSFMARTARRHFDQSHVLVATALLTIFNTYLGDYFSPGDADHHGFMSMLWCGVLYLLTAGEMTERQGFMAGLLLGGITWVSPEGLLLAAPVYTLLGLEALFRPERMQRLAVTTLGTTLLVTAALFIERPLSDILHPYYDSLSIVYVFLFWLVTAAAGLLAGAYPRATSFSARLILAAAAGVAILGVMYGIYPKFFKGPMADADPFIFAHFLPNVSEAQPLFKSPWPAIIRALTEPLLAAGLLACCLWRDGRRMRPAKKRYLLLLAALLLYTLMLTLYQVRWEYYVQPLAIILCAALLPGVAMASRFGLRARAPRQWRPYVWLVVIFGAMNLGAKVVPAHNRVLNLLCMNEIRYVMQTQQLRPILGDKDIVLYIPENAGADALYFTPYSIIASNYHREGPGMKDMAAIADAQNAFDAYKILHRRKVEAMLYCPSDYNPKAWIRAVTETKHYPAWMSPAGGKLKFFTDEDEKMTIPSPVLFKIKP